MKTLQKLFVELLNIWVKTKIFKNEKKKFNFFVLAPEIIKGCGHGKGVDWWSLGILICDTLTGDV